MPLGFVILGWISLNLQTPTMVYHVSFNHIWGLLFFENTWIPIDASGSFFGGEFCMDFKEEARKRLRDFNLKLLPFKKGCLG